jgi:hypothetical protein
MVGIIAAVAMLSAALVVVPTQEANAEHMDKDGKDAKYSKDMKDRKDSKYSKDNNNSYDGNDSDGGNTGFSFEQNQENKCSGSATCTNTATITFGV